MDISFLIIIAALVFIAIISVTFLFRSKREKKDDKIRARPVPNRRPEGAPRRVQVARNRGARLRANAQEQIEEAEEEEDDERQKPNIELPDGKVGAKKLAKLEAKAAKKSARKAEEQIRADKRKRAEQEEVERKKAEEKEKVEEKQREEEEKKEKEEKEKREYEEYLKLKEAFSVEEEGYEEGEQGDEQNLLQEFINYIKDNKVVIIEDLAAHFKLKTQACIDIIKYLQKDDILSGVIDDRGKFIYVSREEMEAVAKFIRQRGRVSIAELAENSSQLINLVPVGKATT